MSHANLFPVNGVNQQDLAALNWLIEAGADEAIEETPRNRLAERAATPRAEPDRAAPKPREDAPSRSPQSGLQEAPSPATTAKRQAAPALASTQESVATARQLAQAAASVGALRDALESFHGCPLKATATQLCFSDGNPESDILMIGEAPGAEEDRQGKPFVGASGRFMDQMLSHIELDRDKVLISNILYWRPPGNRNPTPAEIAACLPFVERLIELVDPKVLVLVGGISAKTLLGRSEGILRLRGRWYGYQHAGLPRPIPALATLHPAYLLRQPAQKRLAWQDYLKLKQVLVTGSNPLT